MSTTGAHREDDVASVLRARLGVVAAVTPVVVAGVLLLPDDIGGLGFVAYTVFALGLAWRSAHFHAPRVRRIIAVVVATGVAFLLGGVVRAVEGVLRNEAYPFPAVADVFSLLAFGLFLYAIGTVVRGRNPHLPLDPILDAVVAVVSVGIIQWTLLVLPYATDPANSPLEVAVTIGFAVVSLTTIGAAVLALVAGSEPSPSNRFLAGGLVMAFVSDALAVAVTGQRASGALLSVVNIGVVAFGAAGLIHPSVAGLFNRPNDAAMTKRLSRRRIVVLSFALATPPVVLLYQLLAGERGAEVVLPAVGSLALAPLVLVRLGRLVRQNESLAALESTLRSVGQRLVAAETDDDVVGIITVGVEQVVNSEFVDGGLLLDPFGQAALGRHDAIGQALRALWDEGRVSERVVTGEMRQVVVADDQVWNVGLVVVDREVRGALLAATRAEPSDEARNALDTLCREAAIALRAVERTEWTVRQRSEERFASLVDNSSDIVTILGQNARMEYVSPVAGRLLGHESADLEGGGFLDLVHPDDREVAVGMLDDVRFGAQGHQFEMRLRHVSGDYHWFDVTGVDLQSDPNIGGIVLNAREVGDRKAAEEKLQLSEARFKALVQNSTDLVLVVDSHGIITYSSPASLVVLGEPAEAVRGRTIDATFRESGIEWEDALRGAGMLDLRFRNAKGDWVQVEVAMSDLRNEPAVAGFVLNARDVTERVQMLKRLRHEATHDSLTGLANRVLVIEELQSMLTRNTGSTTVAVICIDLDDFKDINDSLGHNFGDQLLIAAAERLTDSLSFGDVAARSGGDEFLVVLERSHGENEVMELAASLLESLARPFNIDGRELSITATAGVVCDHDRSSVAEALLRDGDTAMYRAKQAGKQQVVVFEPSMRTESFDRLELRADLARAVGTDQLIPYYQPIIDLQRGTVVGAEALVRWEHPRRGMLSPAIFIPLAEESGLVADVGHWMLQRACDDLARWRSDIPEVASDLTISVNLSAQELASPGLVAGVVGVLEGNHLPPDRLTLEVTESNLVTDTEVAQQRMAELRDLGVRIAIDDFGTGYSSLGYIQRFAFDVLKVDRTFVDGIEQPTNRQIVQAVLDLARQLQVDVVAEGIEEETQTAVLTELGCTLGQGFLYSRPVPAREFRQLLLGWQAATVGV